MKKNTYVSNLRKYHRLTPVGAQASLKRAVDSDKNFSTAYRFITGGFDQFRDITGCVSIPTGIMNFSRRANAGQGKAVNFSAGPGMNNNNGVTAVTALDITLSASVNSLLEFLAVDYACDKPDTILAAKRLVRVVEDENGKTVESVIDPFKPFNYKNMDLSLSAASNAITIKGTGTGSITTNGTPIAIKRTVGKYVNGDTVVLIEDIKGDGTLSLSSSISGFEGQFKLDYLNGMLFCTKADGSECAITDKFEFTFYPDVTSEEDGAHTQAWEPQLIKIPVSCEPLQVKIKNNFEVVSYNTTLFGSNQATACINMAVDGLVYSLNLQSVLKTISAATKNFEGTVGGYIANCYFDNISDYNIGTSHSFTKDNIVNDFLLALDNELNLNSNKGFTYILVGNLGARVLQNVKDRFIRTDTPKGEDALIGYYDGVPVLRHQKITALDASLATETHLWNGENVSLANSAHFFVGYRDPDGEAAPVIYAEYLPITATRASLNYNQPLQFSQMLFNFSKFEVEIANYATVGILKVGK